MSETKEAKAPAGPRVSEAAFKSAMFINSAIQNRPERLAHIADEAWQKLNESYAGAERAFMAEFLTSNCHRPVNLTSLFGAGRQALAEYKAWTNGKT